jgi:predicted nucleic-acid-binding protein
MIGIDANTLLRLIVADDPEQAVAARDFILENCSTEEPGFVSEIVLAEFVWTLARAYRFPRDAISDAIERILETTQLEVASPNDVMRAIEDYRGGTADFADCLLGHSNRAAGCEYTITFDRKAAKLPGFKLLPGA